MKKEVRSELRFGASKVVSKEVTFQLCNKKETAYRKIEEKQQSSGE